MRATPSSPSTSVAEARATQVLSAALLLSFTGGFLDAFLYVAHGGVFAGAITGNVILSAIALFGRDSREIMHHLLPIIGFIAGICAAFFSGTRLRHHCVLIALALESAGLFILSWLPHSFPDQLFIPLLCALAVYQVGTFRKVDSFVYNSTFITGNIVRAVESFHSLQFHVEPRKAKRELRDLGWIVILFALGAVIAARLALRIGNHALLVPMAAVLTVLAMAVLGNLHHPEPAARKAGESN